LFLLMSHEGDYLIETVIVDVLNKAI